MWFLSKPEINIDHVILILKKRLLLWGRIFFFFNLLMWWLEHWTRYFVAERIIKMFYKDKIYWCWKSNFELMIFINNFSREHQRRRAYLIWFSITFDVGSYQYESFSFFHSPDIWNLSKVICLKKRRNEVDCTVLRRITNLE